jgi:TrmH family RNA methyltransferase
MTGAPPAARGPGRVKEVTSPSNPVIKALRALHKKRTRDEQSLFIAEGLKLVIEGLDLGWTLRTLVFARSAVANTAVERVAARTVAAGADVLQVNEKILSAITRRDNPQTVIGVFEQRFAALESIVPVAGDVFVGIDRIRDPGNLGTILRTVDAVGANGVFLIGESTDPFASETVRATMGSIFTVPLARLTQAAFLQWRQGFSGLVAGTHLKGSVDYRSVDYSGGPVMLLMGNDRADSLNLAVATGVMLYEIRRAHLSLDTGEPS